MELPTGVVTYLLDTNAITYHLRGAAQLDPFFAEFARGTAEPAISIITQIELLGFAKLTPREESRIRALLANFSIREVDAEVAEKAVAFRRRYRLGVPDCIIAATACVLDACLVSRDAGLGRISGIRLVNPFAA
jgi:hypothetical protein